jgi:hypothetical protein
MSHAYSTTNTSKRKKKISDSQYHKYAMELNAYNKQMKKYGLKPKTLDEYIAYRQGKHKPELKGAVKSPLVTTTWRRESPNIPSFGDQVGSIPAKPEQKYTGTLVTGIATMHKSNAVPVINQKQMEEIARMRRG